MYYLGVDGGGTKALCCLVHNSKIIWEATYPSCKPNYDLNTTVATVLKILKVIDQKIPANTPLFTGIGWAGLGDENTRQSFTTAILKQYTSRPIKLKVVPDATIACYAAHGSKDGGIIIIGTGSIGWAIIDGKEYRWGGWGIDDGGAGSGYWIGKRALILTTNAYDGLITHSPLTREIFNNFNNSATKLSQTFFKEQKNNAYIASFAKHVVAHAKKQDPHAILLMQKAAQEIEKLCVFGLQINPQENIPMALIGGLAPHISPYLTKNTQKQIILSKKEPIEGAIMLAKSLS